MKCIPKSVTKKNGRRKIWMTSEATVKYRKKQRTWKQYQKSKDHLDYARATKEKNEFTVLVWNISKVLNESRLGDNQDKDGKLTNDDSEKAELLK